MSRQIVVEFLGKDKSLSSTARDAGSSTSRLGDTLKKVGKVAAIGLAAGAVVAGKALFDMTKGAMEDEAAQVKLANTLRNAAGATDEQIASTEKWISAQGTALGVTDDELRPALQRLTEATGDVGEAQKLASLAMDVSAGTGKSLKTVSEALMKAQNGQVSGLSRLGIETKNAAGETLTFEQATAKMSETFKGQAQASANTLEGKMSRLKLIAAETGETIGSKVIPVVTKMADWFLNKGLPALTKFGGYMRDKLGPIFQRVRAIVAQVMGGLSGDVGGKLGEVRAVIADFVSIVRSLWARFGGIITKYAKSTFANLKTIIGGAFKVIAGIFQVFSSLLKGDWKGAWEGIKKIVSGAWSIIKGIVKQAMNIVKTVMRIGWSAVKGIVGAAWDGIKTLARNGVDWLVNAIRSIPERLKSLGGLFANAGRALLQQFIDGMKNAAGIISGIAGNVWDTVRGLLNSAIGKINAALEFRINTPGPDIVVNPPNIPALAKGGVVRARRGGTLALIGEAGHDEAVVPLSGPHAPRGMGGGDTYHVYLQSLDPSKAGEVIEKALIRLSARTGKPIQIRTVG